MAFSYYQKPALAAGLVRRVLIAAATIVKVLQ